MRREMREHPIVFKRRVRRAAAVRAATATSKYSVQERSIEGIVISAKQRCCNPRNAGWPRYGGRGIEFRFKSVEHGIKWISANLGPRPSVAHSLDRKNNHGHYAPGNLRWATAKQQNNNKRSYRSYKYGDQIKRILVERPDLSYETVRRLLSLGYDEHVILVRKKHKHAARTRL